MSVFVCFRVRAFTEIAQTVCVCGNIPELGNWDPLLAVPLQTNENVYPTWMNQNYVLIRSDYENFEIEFKCLIATDEGFIWEETPNRRIDLDCLKTIVFCTYNTIGVSIVPIKKFSTDSLILDQSELRDAKKVQMGRFLNPFESEFDSSSDPESDFQSLLRSRDAGQIFGRERGDSSEKQGDFEQVVAERTSEKQIILKKLEDVELTVFSSQTSITKHTLFKPIDWETVMKEYCDEESKNNSRKSSRFSDGSQSAIFEHSVQQSGSGTFDNLSRRSAVFDQQTTIFEHNDLHEIYLKESQHKLIIISYHPKKNNKAKLSPSLTSERTISPPESPKNQIGKIVKRMASKPMNTVIVFNYGEPYELMGHFGSTEGLFCIAQGGRYVTQIRKTGSEFFDLQQPLAEIWDKYLGLLERIQCNYDYLAFNFESSRISIDFSVITNQTIIDLVMEDLVKQIQDEVGLDRRIKIIKESKEMIIQNMYVDPYYLIDSISIMEAKKKGPIFLSLFVVYNEISDDKLNETIKKVSKKHHKRRIFSHRVKNVYLAPSSKDVPDSNVKCNNLFEMMRLLDKLTRQVSIDFEPESQSLFYN